MKSWFKKRRDKDRMRIINRDRWIREASKRVWVCLVCNTSVIGQFVIIPAPKQGLERAIGICANCKDTEEAADLILKHQELDENDSKQAQDTGSALIPPWTPAKQKSRRF